VTKYGVCFLQRKCRFFRQQDGGENIKIKTNVLSNIDGFIEKERSNMNWWDKLTRNYPEVRNTRSLSEPVIDMGQEKVIRPSIFERVLGMVFALGFVVLWLIFLKMLVMGNGPWGIVLVGLLYLSFLLFIVIRRFFFQKRYNYTVRVSPAGIAINETQFLWSEITETCILTRGEGQLWNNYLIIFKNDGGIVKQDMRMLSVGAIKMATIIEYFKKQAIA
jgi:hypothetical protein